MIPVTVLLPARCASATLPATLASLWAQTLPAFHLLIVNDGSDAATHVAAIQAWMPCAQRPLRILNLPPVGLVAALQRGLQACSTPWVARMDADDLAHPERLARQLSYFETNPRTDVLACGVQSFADGPLGGGFARYDAWQNDLLSHDAMVRERFIESPVVHPTVMFRRACVQAVGGYHDAPWAEDYDLWLRLAAAGARFAKLPDVLLLWRDHPTRATRRDARYGRDAMLRCKAHYLAAGPLRHSRPVVWGAGAMGRRLTRYLQVEGCTPRAFIDVDTRKIGGTRRGGIPVLGVEALPSLRDAPLVAAVGSLGARALIRAAAHAAGWREGENFWCAA